MSFREIAELREMLSLPPHASYEDIKAAYRRAALMFHPDKGGDEEKMKRLNYLMERAREYKPEEDLYCDEELSSSEEEDVPGPSTNATAEDSGYASFTSRGYTSTDAGGQPGSPPHTQEGQGKTFSTPPKGPRDIPLPDAVESCLLAKKSIQSCPEVHLLITSNSKLQELQPLILQHFSTKGYVTAQWAGGYAFMLIILANSTRVSTLINFCCKHCTVSPYVVRGVKKHCLQKLLDVFNVSPEIEITVSQLSADSCSDRQFNYALLNDFACKHKHTDALLLLAIYKRLSVPQEECADCQSQKENLCFGQLKRKWYGGHLDDHGIHHNNAKLFLQLKDQKRVCQGAVDCVLAEKRFKSQTMSRNEQFQERVLVLMESIKEILENKRATDEFCCAIALLHMLVKDPEQIASILETLIKNPPKRRYFVFRGPVNTGKTTVAAAILNLLTGATLNINGSPDRLQFELGCAIDQMMVLFEDVKGQPEDEYINQLPKGLGMINLDNLRDYLEGAVPVNLERKHQNKVSQIFPPGIITMNHYKIPVTVKVRCREIIDFHRDPVYSRGLKANREVVDNRWLTKAETLLAMLFLTTPKSFRDEINGKCANVLDILKIEFDSRILNYMFRIHNGESCFYEPENTGDI
uniref:Large T antigen n=1 Tax=Goose hemorrhagic polyomavirus TaxID=208491 RepID=A0A860PKD0_9POLY|nr:putative large T antigen [Goose hemorrhagic polyomavirus]QNH86124.1 putative large T antigen [Goose hemorrhagic polyomavirus]QNH86130.1 putative large T antigen [Goose hemorrhagic polyomavirus]